MNDLTLAIEPVESRPTLEREWAAFEARVPAGFFVVGMNRNLAGDAAAAAAALSGHRAAWPRPHRPCGDCRESAAATVTGTVARRRSQCHRRRALGLHCDRA